MATPARRPGGAGQFTVDYTPELPDILARLVAVEAPDRARIVLAVSDDRRQITITVLERPDELAVEAVAEVQGRLLAMEPSDALHAAAETDWSDDDREFFEIAAVSLS